MVLPELNDRLAMQIRPGGWPLMRHTWGDLLFLHWQADQQELRRLVPEPLSIDLFDGAAWVAVTPFTLSNVRPVLLPAIPLISSFDEINVRTYVHLDGVPGVWFFSLDTNSLLTVLGARTFYYLPYYRSKFDVKHGPPVTDYKVERAGSAEMSFQARWTAGARADAAVPGTFEFFAAERYCLYSELGGKIYRCLIHHRPWPIRPATVEFLETNILAANDIHRSEGEPHIMHGGPVDVEIWPLERVKD